MGHIQAKDVELILKITEIVDELFYNEMIPNLSEYAIGIIISENWDAWELEQRFNTNKHFMDRDLVEFWENKIIEKYGVCYDIP